MVDQVTDRHEFGQAWAAARVQVRAVVATDDSHCTERARVAA
jgi:hypothetical protein